MLPTKNIWPFYTKNVNSNFQHQYVRISVCPSRRILVNSLCHFFGLNDSLAFGIRTDSYIFSVLAEIHLDRERELCLYSLQQEPAKFMIFQSSHHQQARMPSRPESCDDNEMAEQPAGTGDPENHSNPRDGDQNGRIKFFWSSSHFYPIFNLQQLTTEGNDQPHLVSLSTVPPPAFNTPKAEEELNEEGEQNSPVPSPPWINSYPQDIFPENLKYRRYNNPIVEKFKKLYKKLEELNPDSDAEAPDEPPPNCG